jgi:hypothetical protein
MSIKRHFYNGREYELNKEDKTIILDSNFHQMLLNKKL